MKKHQFITALITGLAVIVALAAGMVQAADKVIDKEIASVTVNLDKNGNEYVRLIVPEKRKLQGIEYETGVAVMAFGEHVKRAKILKPGDRLKASCSSRE